MSQELNTQALVEKWAPVLDADGASSITELHKRQVTAVVLENQEKASIEARSLNEDASITNSTVDNWEPVLISLVRRATPNLIAFDVAGVQAMTGPTGLIFAMKSQYDTTAGAVTKGDEALHNNVDTSFSGPVSTAIAEFQTMNTMGFSIEKTAVTARTRALKANYTVELAQDLKAVHGLSAETELANILSTEILAEINREVIETMESQAISAVGGVANEFDATVGTGTSKGRWEVEVFKGLIYHLSKEANIIAQETRRGKGNFIVCSSDVAAALNATGSMDYGLVSKMDVDVTGSLLAGTLNGMKVFVDPFAVSGSVVVGYKGTNPYDAGMFYCPYVPLSMMKTVGQDDFQPRIGFKTRYGMAANPFVSSTVALGAGINPYFRSVAVSNL